MPQTRSFAVSDLWTREFRIDLGPAIRLAKQHPEAMVLVLGVLLRLLAYGLNRAMWLDEQALKGNIVGVRLLDFSEPLKGDQLAPFGFLIFQRAIATIVSGRNHVLRFLPLAAGIASLVLFSRLASRLLPRRAALVALALFAFSADLVYYSNEMKPYSLDVAFGLAITLMAVGAMGRTPSPRSSSGLRSSPHVRPGSPSPRPSSSRAAGSVLLADALLAGRYRVALLWVLIGAGWLANFLVSYQASRAILSPYTTMYRFWDFAFLPFAVPPTRDVLLKDAALLLEVFVNPLNLLAPRGSQLGVVIPLILLVVGSFSLARQRARPSCCSLCRSRWPSPRRSPAITRSTAG